MVGEQALDPLLDPVELTDAVECLFGKRRAGGGMAIEELAPHLRPAAGLDNPPAFEQTVEAGIAIGRDGAAKVLQMRPWVLTPGLRRGRLLRSGE